VHSFLNYIANALLLNMGNDNDHFGFFFIHYCIFKSLDNKLKHKTQIFTHGLLLFKRNFLTKKNQITSFQKDDISGETEMW
jgi:hypothetical protein